jgi:hypothetical protein
MAKRLPDTAPVKTNRLLRHILSSTTAPCTLEEYRCTGRSTAIALKLIAWCIENPGLERLVLDHHGTLDADRVLLRMVEEIITSLDLQFFVFTKTSGGRTLMRCDIWE